MSAEFSKLCKRLIVASAVAVLTPLAAALALGGASAAADSGFPTEQAEAVPAPHAPVPLSTLGRASAVAWIGAGHVSAR